MKQWAVAAEKLGFDSFWKEDHMMYPQPTPCLEAWTTISYLSGFTESIKFSNSVLIPDFRYPAVLAKMAASLDHFSEGRLILTFGGGWFKGEFEGYGCPWSEHDERIAREREAILLIQKMFTEEVISFEGEYYTLKQATMDPKPFQKPYPPIWVAGQSDKTMDLVVELADGWLMYANTPDKLKENIEEMKGRVQGKEKEMSYACSVVAVMGKTYEEAKAKADILFSDEMLEAASAEMEKHFELETAKRLKELSGGRALAPELANKIVGAPENIAEQVEAFAGAGIDHLILTFLEMADLELFAEEVLPRFKSS
jgi:FMNH2-dependent dimethyl sulfone monooxygenase